MTSSRRALTAGDAGSGVGLPGPVGRQAPHLGLATAWQPPTAAVKLGGGRAAASAMLVSVLCVFGSATRSGASVEHCRVGTGFVSSAGVDCSQLSLHRVPQLTSYALVNSRNWFVRFEAFCSAICLNYRLVD